MWCSQAVIISQSLTSGKPGQQELRLHFSFRRVWKLMIWITIVSLCVPTPHLLQVNLHQHQGILISSDFHLSIHWSSKLKLFQSMFFFFPHGSSSVCYSLVSSCSRSWWLLLFSQWIFAAAMNSVMCVKGPLKYWFIHLHPSHDQIHIWDNNSVSHPKENCMCNLMPLGPVQTKNKDVQCCC